LLKKFFLNCFYQPTAFSWKVSELMVAWGIVGIWIGQEVGRNFAGQIFARNSGGANFTSDKAAMVVEFFYLHVWVCLGRALINRDCSPIAD
jgi:hypothetical protein